MRASRGELAHCVIWSHLKEFYLGDPEEGQWDHNQSEETMLPFQELQGGGGRRGYGGPGAGEAPGSPQTCLKRSQPGIPTKSRDVSVQTRRRVQRESALNIYRGQSKPTSDGTLSSQVCLPHLPPL